MPSPFDRPVGYQVPRSNRYLIRIVIATVLMTLAILAILPFTQALSGDPRDKTIRSVDTANLPPPEPPPPEPPPPEEEEEEEVEDLQEPPKPLNLSQLEVALNPGFGDAVGEGFDLGAFDIKPDTLSEIAIFTLKDLDTVPRLLRQPEITIPKELRDRGVKGVVRLVVILNERGQVSVESVESSPNPELNPVATVAAERTLWEIPTKDGQPGRVRFIMPLNIE